MAAETAVPGVNPTCLLFRCLINARMAESVVIIQSSSWRGSSLAVNLNELLIDAQRVL